MSSPSKRKRDSAEQALSDLECRLQTIRNCAREPDAYIFWAYDGDDPVYHAKRQSPARIFEQRTRCGLRLYLSGEMYWRPKWRYLLPLSMANEIARSCQKCWLAA